ncbi:MAG: polyketide synthase dehydratase domain-containing protein [Desulfobacterales bacterium]
MEGVSTVIDSVHLPIDLPLRPCLRDHCVDGQAVLPAVEAMEALARAVTQFRPETPVADMSGIAFDKFLPCNHGRGHLSAFIDAVLHANGDVTASLATRTPSKNAAMTRVKTHAVATWPRQAAPVPNLPLDVAAAPEGACLHIPGETIYPGLVAFGPAYRNVVALHLARGGVVAEIRTPLADDAAAARPALLGSPFALDAAFHAACAWGQRFAGIVAFPVALDRRRVHAPTRPGETYFAHVAPLQTNPALLIFDLRIYNREGGLHETCTGVSMRDVSGGRLQPPGWIRAVAPDEAAARIAGACKALSMIEPGAMAPFAEKSLSEPERRRMAPMSGRRRRSYLAARLACKRISRRLSGHDLQRSPRAITTICEDRPSHPCCPLAGGRAPVSCSVSHDDRFAIAVASDRRVGVDVEKVSERVLKTRSLFMSEPEQALVPGSPLGEAETAVRIWSIKEAVTKALDIRLADAWQRVRVISVGSAQSRYQIDGRDASVALHDAIGRHVITLV